ncbi:MAG TPA: glycosyltransferase [Verrucomicrobiae bacterium]|jgi:spore maturation protein CgeB|nr:glycosyltransferase [Verrucomicrobiae bacterium]
MKGKLRFRIFAHSWLSDWNHGNSHFLRGLARELVRLGHEVRCYEEMGSWSLTHLMQEGEIAGRAIDQFRAEFPELDVRFYDRETNLDETLSQELRDADVVILHEWTDPAIAHAILSHKARFGFRALFHDTHHRAYTNAGEILRFPLHLFDGVLAFGEPIRRIYLDGFGVPRAWTFHEAADISHYHPLDESRDTDLLWIGNWGDEERSRELMEYLVAPATELCDCKVVAYGVRYPEAGRRSLAEAGIEYRGYLPSLMTPRAYSRSALSLHVPRRQYTNGLSGIPTIRVFEALACGASLICAPWSDVEELFRPGEDYMVVNSGSEMTDAIQHLLRDESARRQMGANGRQTILQQHTCAHRAEQLVGICEELG